MYYNYPALPEFVCKQNLFMDLIIIGIGAAIAGPVGFFLAYFYVGSCRALIKTFNPEMSENIFLNVDLAMKGRFFKLALLIFIQSICWPLLWLADRYYQEAERKLDEAGQEAKQVLEEANQDAERRLEDAAQEIKQARIEDIAALRVARYIAHEKNTGSRFKELFFLTSAFVFGITALILLTTELIGAGLFLCVVAMANLYLAMKEAS